MIRSTNKYHQTGFSLIEMAIVMVILGFIISSLVGPVDALRETQKLKQAKAELAEIQEAIMGYAIVNGFIPCPGDSGSDGLESRTGNNCNYFRGSVPARTLGIEGKRNDNGQLVDPWNVPYDYAISGVGFWSYAKNIQLNNPNASIRVCSEAQCPSGTTLAENIVFIVLSRGPNGANFTSSPDQIENNDMDGLFVEREESKGGNQEFDDILSWTSKNTLIANLVKAGRL